MKVYLTRLGGGVFGVPIEWIDESIHQAMQDVSSSLLDVYLVEFG